MTFPLHADLIVRENADYTAEFLAQNPDGTAVNFTGATAAQLMVRADISDAAAVLTLALGAGITLGGTAGTITIAITAAQASGLATSGLVLRKRGAYDLIVTDSLGKKQTYLEGVLQMFRSPTR